MARAKSIEFLRLRTLLRGARPVRAVLPLVPAQTSTLHHINDRNWSRAVARSSGFVPKGASLSTHDRVRRHVAKSEPFGKGATARPRVVRKAPVPNRMSGNNHAASDTSDPLNRRISGVKCTLNYVAFLPLTAVRGASA